MLKLYGVAFVFGVLWGIVCFTLDISLVWRLLGCVLLALIATFSTE